MSKHIRILWLLTIILVLSCQNGNIVPIFDTENELGIWVDLWNTYDLTQVENIFITDNTVTYFSSEKEGLVKGFDAVVEHHRGFGFVEGGKETGNKLWLEDLNTQVHDSSVTVSGIWFFRRSTDDEGAEPQKGPVTFVYVYTERGYRIAHVNFSTYRVE